MFVVHYNLKNTTRCGNLLNNTEMNTYLNINSVKMSLTRGQSAWNIRKIPSETQRSAFSSKRLLLADSTNFNHWLVGVVDGDGTFYFETTKENVWSFSFQINQSSANAQLLYFIKSALEVGQVTIDEKNEMALYRLRKKDLIISHVLPIFDTHPLLTRDKHFKYSLFRQAILISTDPSLSTQEKTQQILNLKLQYSNVPENYLSPVWSNVGSNLSEFKTEVIQIIHKSWLIGFTEAEGSFYIARKSKTRLVHAFEITQKGESVLMEGIALVLGLKVTEKRTHSTIVTTKQERIQFISDFFFKTMKGTKSLEYRIWARSFTKRSRGFDYLLDIRERMRKIRAIRLDKNLKKNPSENEGIVQSCMRM